MMLIRYVICALALCAWLGCSKGNDQAIILDATGKHPAGWVVPLNGGNHPAMYISSPEQCRECHGADLLGGISKVSCFSADRNGVSCHAQGPRHPDGWSAAEAHGARAKAAAVGANGMAFCTNCHGADYRGGGTSQKDCLRCHTTAPHPAKPWTGTRSHTSADPSNAPACARCHTGRANLSPAGLAKLPATATIGAGGCFDNTLCHGVMGHSSDPQPWSLPANHGTRAKADPGAGGNTGLAACQQCHGADFATVRGTNSCIGCHGVAAPHPSAAHWRSAGTISHTTTGVNNAAVCAQCHNAAQKNLSEPYLARFTPAGSFGVGATGCFNGTLCHADITRTSNCTVCHGPLSTTSFNSLAGVTAPADAKVGAHIKHLNASTGQPVACTECHAVPASPAASGSHRDGTVQVVFGTLARTGGLTPTVSRDPASGALVCSNTYCHGASLNGGSNKAPRWNDTAYNAGCATCHGYPPATTRSGGSHSANTACSSCHTHVNATNNGFTDPTKHINGSVEATGSHSFPNPGSAHKSASNGTGCRSASCHPTDAAGSAYPVAAGTPPNCRACHLNNSPSTDPHCSDCHGSAGNDSAGALLAGRPPGGGTTFPNRPGQHNRSEHVGRACTVCHPFTSGDARHGWSNRQKSTSAQVNASTGWNATTKTCSNSCHGTERWY